MKTAKRLFAGLAASALVITGMGAFSPSSAEARPIFGGGPVNGLLTASIISVSIAAAIAVSVATGGDDTSPPPNPQSP